MAADPDSDSTILAAGIQALPPATVRQIGASQCLVDPSSVVKELIDNALDASATAIYVDITANTIDSIQVKDTGHGIPTEDRAMACRKYCTSKIRDFNDLKAIGGTSLGFRGEALASMAEMSGSMTIITKVEGEPVAALLKYGRNGEVQSAGRASHPVGTTVKVTDFCKSFPVRKQAALKHSAKYRGKIKRLVQAYALARPTVRFQLRILKAKDGIGNLVYAPKAGANVKDAAFKVISRECAKQCDWTALETDGFEIHAFLPKPDAIASTIANYGAFVAVDSRPVSTGHGTLKHIAAAFKETLRKANREFANTKDPFFCMNIICPANSYDPNIEPAKDDVLFTDGNDVLEAVNKLLAMYYAEAAQGDLASKQNLELPTSAQVPSQHDHEKPASVVRPSSAIFEDQFPGDDDEVLHSLQEQPSNWKSTMYGIGEEDVALLAENSASEIEEDDGDVRAVDISNPWTIAKMNSPIKSKTMLNEQLITPKKSQREVTMFSSPSVPSPSQQKRRSSIQPLTPQTASKLNTMWSPLVDVDSGLRQFPQTPSNFNNKPPREVDHPYQQALPRPALMDSLDTNSTPNNTQLHMIGFHSSPQRQSRRNTQAPQAPTAPSKDNETRFGNASLKRVLNGNRRKKQTQGTPILSGEDRPFGSRGEAMEAVACPIDRLTSKNNTDIRGFLVPRDLGVSSASTDIASSPSFTSTNSKAEVVQRYTNRKRQSQRPSSAGSSAVIPRSKAARDPLNRNGTQLPSAEEVDVYFRACKEQEETRDRLAVQKRQTWDPLDAHKAQFKIPSRNLREQRKINSHRGTSAEPQDITMHFQGHPDTDPAASIHLGRAGLTTKFVAGRHRVFESPAAPPVVANGTTSKRPRSVDSFSTDPPPQAKCRCSSSQSRSGRTRSRSLRRTLSFTPKSHLTQNLIQLRVCNTKTITRSMRKLDMARNTPEWGYPVQAAHDAFEIPIPESVIREWCVFIDERLDESFERVEGMDVIGVMTDGLRKALQDCRA